MQPHFNFNNQTILSFAQYLKLRLNGEKRV